jgi:hypothetical protein
MIPLIKKIIGQKISEVALFEYTTQIIFKDGSRLTCYYPLIFSDGNNYKSIIGDALKDIEDTDEEILLVFKNQIVRINKKLDIDPEFMELTVAGEETIVVWNE